ncbi:MAG: hypothetical protein K0V04_41530 [Deltaproteobacteria bacterium]|nr:hypothetical protein [Deltaproteobacteria bacterium]
MIVALRCLAPAAPDDNPFSMFAGWDTGQLVWLAILVPIAVMVFFVGSRRYRSQLGAGSITPRGRDRFVPGGRGRRDAAWRATVERLEARPPATIAEASDGPLRVEGELVWASGNLGGAPGRECVWRNRAGAGPQTAVAADLVIVADASGRCGVEQLEGARVTAPVDKAGAHYESTSLHVGDRVEVIAMFEREVVGEHEDPAQLVYGTLGADGRVSIRVIERPPPAAASPDDAQSDAPDNEP